MIWRNAREGGRGREREKEKGVFTLIRNIVLEEF